MADAEVKQPTKRTRKTTKGAAPKAASAVSKPQNPTTETVGNTQVTKLPNGLVIVSR